MSAPVDVLAVMESLCRGITPDLDSSDCDALRWKLRDARAAVAELIEADKAFDKRSLAQSAEEWDAIVARRDVALARVSGGMRR